MAVASWMLRDGILRSGRTFNRSKCENEEDTVLLDATKDASENAYEILWNICKKQGLTDGKRLAYLNVFTKLIEEANSSNDAFLMSKEDIMCCLKLGLVSSNTLVRAGGLRVIRYFINSPDDVVILNKLQIPNLIARSIDLVLKNDHERIQAFRLTLKILNLCPKQFSIAVTRSLVSLANSINENKDRMIYSCLAILSQLCILNPDLLIECCGQTALLRCSLEISHSRINECLVGCLLFLLNKPETRNKAKIQLDYLMSIYCDWQRKKPETNESMLYASSKLSIMAALRTWSGVFHLCQPNNVSGIKAIVDVLYLDQFDVRKAILELLYEVLGLDHETWSDEISAAVENIDPSKHQESWKLSERFVAAEGKDILPNKACSRPNLTEIHTALIVYTFLECGLLSALVEIIISTDAFLSIQAIILLGVILHLSHKLLPTEVIDLTPGLPTLVGYITNGLPRQRTQALMAVSSLYKMHELFKSRPAPHSLFLHQLMCHGNWYKSKTRSSDTESVTKSKSSKRKSSSLQVKDVEEHIKESGVFTVKDPRSWNWNHIKTSLRCQNESFVRLEEVQHKNYIKKLVSFFKPSTNQYSVIENSNKTRENNIFTTTGFCLVDFLLRTEEGESHKLLNDFLSDLSTELNEIVSNKNVHEILLSPQNVANTLSQHYFLIVGHLSGTHKGIRALDKCSILQNLLEIVGSCKHESYIKLIVSSLDYHNSTMTRIILSKAMSSPIDSIRMYTTELLLVLARCSVHNFSKWGLDLLVAQMYDENKLVATASINILHELCYDPVYLESLVNTRPSLLHLGDKGHLLLIRFLSTTSGFTFLSDANFVVNELENWEKGYNYRYVGLVEGDLHDSLTLHQRNDDGRYTRRLTNAKHKWKDVFVIPHLYGELSQHEKGFQAIVQNGFIFKMIQCVQNGYCATDAEILELKSSLWGLSNLGTSELGLELLEQENLIQIVVNIAHNCPVLSVRATAFYCICLLSTTIAGANALALHGWHSLRRNRCEKWPIVETEYLMMEEPRPVPDDIESISSATYESDETDSATSELHKFPFDVKSPIMKNKKASTLPTGILASFEEKCNLERRNTLDSQGSEASDDVIVKPGNEPVPRRSHQRSYSESFYGRKRPSSETSFDGSEGNPKLSFQDALGLATLQSLHSYRRPEITSNINSELEQPDFRKRFSSQDRSSNSPMSDFEAHNPPKLFSNASSSSLSSLSQRTPVATARNASGLNTSGTSTSNTSSCVYQGICLPKALAQFMMITEMTSERREERKTLRKRGSLSFSEMEQVKELEEENLVSSSSSDNSESEDSKSLKKSRDSKKLRHNAANCIACCMKVSKGKRQRKISTGSFRLRTDTESSYGNPNESSPISLKWRLRTRSESAFQNYTGGSGESISNMEPRREEAGDGIAEAEHDDSGGSVPSLHTEIVSHAKVRRDILKHVNRMCNPVWAKASKQSLLQLKQSHPSVFQDVCLYSSVCNILSSSSCRVTARRFIQELFLDLTFAKVYDDAANVLQQYAPSATTGGPSATTETTTFTTASAQSTATPSSSSPAPPPSSDVKTSQPDEGVTLPKTLIPNSKCTSPTNLATLYENVQSSPFVHFNAGQCFMEVLQNSSSQVRFTFKPEDKIPNT